MCDCRSCLCSPSPSSLEAILSSKAAYVAFSKFARIRFQSWTDSSDTRGRSSLALTLMTSVRDGNADSVVPFPKVSPTDAPITRIMCFSRASCRSFIYGSHCSLRFQGFSTDVNYSQPRREDDAVEGGIWRCAPFRWYRQSIPIAQLSSVNSVFAD